MKIEDEFNISEFVEDVRKYIADPTLDEDDALALVMTAISYINPVLKGYKIDLTAPQSGLILEVIQIVAADIYKTKTATFGLVGLNNDGVEAYRISSDPLRGVYNRLRALGVPAGLGIA